MDNVIKVLVVDDSFFMRKVISEILEQDPQLKVIGTANDGFDALEKIRTLKPDVVTLDIDMPGMDGLSVIRRIMILNPLPVVVFSSLFCYGDVTFESLGLGVIDFVPKPSGMVSSDKDHLRRKITDRVKNAAGVKIGNIRRVSTKSKPISIPIAANDSLDYIIPVGAGLSGTNAVVRLASQLDPKLPAALVAMLEIAPPILPSFVEKFNEHVHWDVTLIEDGQVVEPGVCYIGSNENAVRVGLNDDNDPCFRLEGKMPDPLNMLFESAANLFNNNTIGVLLAGLGDDGASGFSHIQVCNGVTIAQDTNCCVYPNLPQNAIAMGAATQVVDESLMALAIDSCITLEGDQKVA